MTKENRFSAQTQISLSEIAESSNFLAIMLICLPLSFGGQAFQSRDVPQRMSPTCQPSSLPPQPPLRDPLCLKVTPFCCTGAGRRQAPSGGLAGLGRSEGIAKGQQAAPPGTAICICRGPLCAEDLLSRGCHVTISKSDPAHSADCLGEFRSRAGCHPR